MVTHSDVAGRFQFQTIPPGSYKVFAWEAVDKGTWQDPELMRDYEALGKPLRIEEGMKASIDVVSIPPRN